MWISPREFSGFTALQHVWDSFSFHIPTDQCRITKRCKEETQNYKEHKVLCWGLWMTHRVSARGSCLQHRKRVTWLSKRISDWQLSWEIHTPIGTYVSLLDTAIKPEIFRFLEHVVFGLWLGIKGKVFLILFEQGYECWRPPHSSFTPFRPLAYPSKALSKLLTRGEMSI